MSYNHVTVTYNYNLCNLIYNIILISNLKFKNKKIKGKKIRNEMKINKEYYFQLQHVGWLRHILSIRIVKQNLYLVI